MPACFNMVGDHMKIKVAGVDIQLPDADSYTEFLSQDYKTNAENCDLTICVSEREIRHVCEEGEGINFPASVQKSFAILEKLNTEMLEFDAFYLHAATISVDGRAYAFTAKSGTGKTTHMNLWKQYFGHRAFVVNGDRPFLRKIEDTLYACGSPWCGKEGWQTNAMVPLQAICFLERGTENTIEKISDAEVTERIFRQLRMPNDMGKMTKLLELLDWIEKNIPCYRLKCNMSMDAVEVSYNGMQEE